jgi:hypothetical protein
LPVADLVGLRFSVVHLRLAGYALLGVWANEIVSLLSTPMLEAVGTRLASISQALDLAPLLLVGIGLVAFQGGGCSATGASESCCLSYWACCRSSAPFTF